MKHVYPLRHPASLDTDTAAGAPAGSSRDGKGEPALPHERDESSSSQARAAPNQADVGRQAYDNATDGTTDTDKGPLMDEVYNEKIAEDRGPTPPRR